MAEEKNDLLIEAEAVLKQNDRKKWTVPAGDLYPHQWLWDSCFIAIGLRHIDLDRAQVELRSLLRGQWSNGMLPDMIFAPLKGFNFDELLWDSAISPDAPDNVDTSGITQPPMLAEAVVRVGQKLSLTQRRTWYRSMQPAIVRFHKWLYAERDPRHEGLITLVHPYESGLDDSPPWIDELKTRGYPLWVSAIDKLHLGGLVNSIRRDTRHTPPAERMSNVEALAFFVGLRRLRRRSYDSSLILKKPYLAVQDLAFNCILIRANNRLKQISKISGLPLDQDLLDNMTLSEEALSMLWHEQSGHYYSRSYKSERLIEQPTIAGLLPLYAGSIAKERAEQLVKLMRKSTGFASQWPLPSVPMNSSYFNPVRYWQGPTWVNLNWLIIDGLSRYGYDIDARELREKTLQLVRQSGNSEYYNPLSAQPLGANAFSWTAALTIDLLKT